MNAAEYARFTDTMVCTLAADPDVLGLAALGSTADATHRDESSDHDFWVITRPGHQHVLLDDLSWMPNSDEILVALRRGGHYGLLYRDGHLAEFAVSDPDEASHGTVTVYTMLLDRADVAASVARARENARREPWDEGRCAFVFDSFLILLRTAVARWDRGEHLSARRYLAHYAVDSLLNLALELLPGQAAGIRDPVDPRRRIERQHPQLAAAVDVLLCAPVPEGAAALLDVAEETLAPHWPNYPGPRAAAVRAMLASAAAQLAAGTSSPLE